MEMALPTPTPAIRVRGKGVKRTHQTCAAPQPARAPQPDEELVTLIIRRDEIALKSIYERYHRFVYTIAARITADHAVAEEVVQDVFQAVWQSAATFQPQSSFVGWLVGITRHRAIDATRSRRYRSRLYEDIFDDERLASAVRSEDGHDDALLLRFTMRAALDELPPAQRRTIELAYYGGLTHVEIAEQIGEPIGTIKSRLRLGLTKLRVLLGSFGFDERE